jgi:hypothetical protein
MNAAADIRRVKEVLPHAGNVLEKQSLMAHGDVIQTTTIEAAGAFCRVPRSRAAKPLGVGKKES